MLLYFIVDHLYDASLVLDNFSSWSRIHDPLPLSFSRGYAPVEGLNMKSVKAIGQAFTRKQLKAFGDLQNKQKSVWSNVFW